MTFTIPSFPFALSSAPLSARLLLLLYVMPTSSRAQAYLQHLYLLLAAAVEEVVVVLAYFSCSQSLTIVVLNAAKEEGICSPTIRGRRAASVQIGF